MFELYGKYASAKIFTDVIEEAAVSQIMAVLNQPVSQGARVRIMPDVHAGKDCTVGTTMTITDKAIPNLVGTDIGCGMETIRLKERDIDPEALDRLIYSSIPSGLAIRKEPHEFYKKAELENLYCYDNIDLKRAVRGLGSLGGGNHFIEADRAPDGSLYIVIHSGSRSLGKDVALYYQRAAYEQLNGSSAEDIEKLTKMLKKQGKANRIEREITKLKNTKRTDIPRSFAYARGELLEKYLHDMKIVQQYAVLSRKAIAADIIKGLGLTADDSFTTIHNYIDTENMILRKGAVSAKTGETLIIPINMCDGSLICTGKGNTDWNCSAPHGAGRLMSRSAANEPLSVEEYKRRMQGIYTSSVGYSTIDESPMAYKNINDIISNISETVDINEIIKPVYNFKAGGR